MWGTIAEIELVVRDGLDNIGQWLLGGPRAGVIIVAKPGRPLPVGIMTGLVQLTGLMRPSRTIPIKLITE